MNDKGESVQELHYFGARARRLGGDGYVLTSNFFTFQRTYLEGYT